jgi:hypothetical protein
VAAATSIPGRLSTNRRPVLDLGRLIAGQDRIPDEGLDPGGTDIVFGGVIIDRDGNRVIRGFQPQGCLDELGLLVAEPERNFDGAVRDTYRLKANL